MATKKTPKIVEADLVRAKKAGKKIPPKPPRKRK